MTAFIIGAALLTLLAVLFVTLPLLRSRGALAPAATAALLVALGLISFSAIVYSLLGNPAGIRWSAGAASSTAQNIAKLARHAQESPHELSAWLALGQAYSANGQYALALHAYEQANSVAGGQDATALAGMGEALLLPGDNAQVPTASGYLERALQLDPHSAKALFYSALIAYQNGQLQVARERFAAMLQLTPAPPQNVRVALQRQIEQIDAQLHPRIDPATAIQLHVSLAPALTAKVPPNASLFVFVQAPGGGPPLAVKRSSVQLPQEVELSADDAMIAQRTVRPGQKVTVVARISASGSPLAQSGDLYGQIEYIAGKTGPRSLEIDKLNP